MLRGDAVDDPWVPIVQVGGQVIDEDHRYAAIDAQLSVDEPSAAPETDFVGAFLYDVPPSAHLQRADDLRDRAEWFVCLS